MRAKIFLLIILLLFNSIAFSAEDEEDEADEEDVPVQTVKALPQSIYLYWDGRLDIPPPALKLNALIIAYAILKHDSKMTYVTDYENSGNFQKAGNRHHLMWNSWVKKYAIIGGQAFLSYGGELNVLLRRYIIDATPAELDKIAVEIRMNMKRYGFTGIDLNVQHWWNYSKSDNEKFAKNFVLLIKSLRKTLDQDASLKNAPITVAVGWNAAGKVTGLKDYDSTYTASMLSFFRDPEVIKALTAITVLTFGINDEDFYLKTDKINSLLSMFVTAGVPKQKIMLAIQPYLTANATALNPYDVVQIGKFIKQNGYAGITVTGITPGNAIEVRADEYIEAIRNGLELIEVLPPPAKPK